MTPTHSLSLFGNDSDVRHLDIGHIRLATSTTRRHLIKKKANDQVCVWGYTGGSYRKSSVKMLNGKGIFYGFRGSRFIKPGEKRHFFVFFLWNNEDTPCGCLKYFFATLLDTGFTGCDFLLKSKHRLGFAISIGHWRRVRVWAREVAPKGKWRACFARAATAASGEHDALKHIMFVFFYRDLFLMIFDNF